MKEKAAATGIYGVLHFLVDFCCAFFIFRMMQEAPALYLYFFIYNFCAFALQMPVGLLADRFHKNSLTAISGCILTAVVPLFYGVLQGETAVFAMDISAVVLIGLGNCLFHVGGGIEILRIGKDKLWPLGIFVSPGAAGIFFGNILGKGETVPFVLPYILLLLGAVILFLWQDKNSQAISLNRENEKEKQRENLHKKGVIAAIICFAAVVVLRSHLGMIYSFPWKREIVGSIFCLIGVMAGKAAGGILADRFGIARTIFFSLAAAGVCFFFAENVGFGVIGIFCFNMSMPLTLHLAYKALESRGFAFGILTFAIFIGFLPAYFGNRSCSPILLVIYSLGSLLLLIAGYGFMKGAADEYHDA
ncbi:MAG: MFS transporter [Lachnospiraceae bacterium]|nr:MFS transporter [Lachnospiraceae bacterium]